MRGFNVNDEDDNGFLGMSEDKKDYKIVKDQSQALKFPSANVYNVDGFGTPQEWLEFFKGEHELSSWKFHLLKIKAPRN